MQYIINRLKEASTWRGFALLLTAFGVHIAPELQEAVIAAGVGVAGLIGVAFPDKKEELYGAPCEKSGGITLLVWNFSHSSASLINK